jgi:hypothetical protein
MEFYKLIISNLSRRRKMSDIMEIMNKRKSIRKFLTTPVSKKL